MLGKIGWIRSGPIELRFEEVKIAGRKVVKCAQCGKKIRRQRTFMQTLNPFNCNLEGKPKSREEIRRELRAEIDRWEGEPELCRACDEEIRRELRAEFDRREGEPEFCRAVMKEADKDA